MVGVANLKLVFHGLRWPAVQVAESRVDHFDFDDDGDTWGRRVTFAQLTTRGDGRRWTATSAQAFWRNFAEINLEDDSAIIDFVKRHGDPDSQLSPTHPVRTRWWRPLRDHLRPFARAWDDGDAHGLSRLSQDAKRIALAKTYGATIGKPFFAGLPPLRIDGDVGFALEFNRLGDFMIASAVDQLHRAASMRRCDACGDWYEAKRSTSKTCSSSCRNALLKLKQKGD